MTRPRGRAPAGERLVAAVPKLKQLMRSAGHRTVAAQWGDVQRMLDRVTASDAAGFTRHCGSTLRVE